MPSRSHWRDKDKGKYRRTLHKRGQKSSDKYAIQQSSEKYAIQLSPKKKRKQNIKLRTKFRCLYNKDLNKLTGDISNGSVNLLALEPPKIDLFWVVPERHHRPRSPQEGPFPGWVPVLIRKKTQMGLQGGLRKSGYF